MQWSDYFPVSEKNDYYSKIKNISLRLRCVMRNKKFTCKISSNCCLFIALHSSKPN